jgi:hypothetical protein
MVIKGASSPKAAAIQEGNGKCDLLFLTDIFFCPNSLQIYSTATSVELHQQRLQKKIKESIHSGVEFQQYEFPNPLESVSMAPRCLSFYPINVPPNF